MWQISVIVLNMGLTSPWGHIFNIFASLHEEWEKQTHHHVVCFTHTCVFINTMSNISNRIAVAWSTSILSKGKSSDLNYPVALPSLNDHDFLFYSVETTQQTSSFCAEYNISNFYTDQNQNLCSLTVSSYPRSLGGQINCCSSTTAL